MFPIGPGIMFSIIPTIVTIGFIVIFGLIIVTVKRVGSVE